MTPIPPPAGVPAEAWRRFPLAKRRLAMYGPGDGDVAIWETFVVVAAEARQQGLSAKQAETLCRSIPFDAARPAERARGLRELPRIVQSVYRPRDGLPFLTGCPRDPQHTGNPHTSRLRSRFAPFCDEECARSCVILRAAAQAAAVLAESPFAAVYHSSLWAEGVKLGLGTRGLAVYEKLAIRALADPEHTVPASQRYLAAKLGDRLSHQAVGKKLRIFHRIGLATLLDRETGLRRVHALTPEEVRELEENHGTAAIIAQRRASRERQSSEYADWISEKPARRAQWELARTRTPSARRHVQKVPTTPAGL